MARSISPTALRIVSSTFGSRANLESTRFRFAIFAIPNSDSCFCRRVIFSKLDRLASHFSHAPIVPGATGRNANPQTSMDITADVARGFISRVTTWGGNAVHDRIYLGPKVYPGKMVFPTVAIDATCYEGTLQNYQIIVIDEAHFNEPPAGRHICRPGCERECRR